MVEHYTSHVRRNVQGTTHGVMDEGLRAYMLRVYNYMSVGLLVTGIVAMVCYGMAVTDDPARAVAQVSKSVYLTEFGRMIFVSPLVWVIMFAPLGVCMFLSFGMRSMSISTMKVAFWSYSTLMGLSLSSIFLYYTSQSISQIFFVSAATFGCLSLFGYVTQRDLSSWGSFLFMGLIGLIISSIVNIFLVSSALNFAISAAGVLVFAGLTAYDTQRIKEVYYMSGDSAVASRNAIMGALSLYLDFINLFLMLLRLGGSARE